MTFDIFGLEITILVRIKRIDMADRAIIWRTLQLMLKETINPDSVWVNIKDTFWKDFDEEKQIRLRRLLLINKLIGVHDDDQWIFKLTAEGIVAKESDFNRKGIIRKSYKQFWLGVIATLIGAVVSICLTYILEVWKLKHQPKPQTNIAVSPQIQLKTDTIYVKIKK